MQSINGLSVDAQKIGAGIYSMICERDQAALVAFGLLPKWAMDLAERVVREKIKSMVPPEDLDRTVADIMREISSGIYAAAASVGQMIV